MYKKFLNNLRDKPGNVTILILIMGLVVILATTVLTRFMFRDITFTRLDESKLRALNIAEAGVSDLFYKIEKSKSLVIIFAMLVGCLNLLSLLIERVINY